LSLAGDRAHAALMDGIYRHERHIYDLTRSYFLLGRDRMIEELAPPAGGSALEIGSGTGRNLIEAAIRYPGVTFFGIDISSQMLKTARRAISATSAAKRIALVEANASSFEPQRVFGRDRFDRVFFSYSLSMIPEWRKALAHAAGMVAPGGKLLVVDFGQCECLPRWFKIALFGWLKLYHVRPLADLFSAMAELAGSAGARMEREMPFRGYVWRATLILP
jgi:S-adenosylmethionine-diacylgycerolhomoserine-N-methlytransferase